MVLSPEVAPAALCRKTPSEVSGSSLHLRVKFLKHYCSDLEQWEGAEVLIKAQFVCEPSISELLGRELPELSVKLKHMIG